MRTHHSLLLAASVTLALPACKGGRIDLDAIDDAWDIEEICDEYEPETVVLEVMFDAQTEACPWNQDDNQDLANGYLTARVEQTSSLEMPEESVICDMAFDFGGIVPGEIQIMVYDDQFFFTFNDVVLAASLEPAVEQLPEVDELRYYDWSEIVGMEYHGFGNYDSYCLGEDEGTAECDIPETEVSGPISLSFDDDVINELSLEAILDERYDFSFITTGDDNPETDCKHEAFGFTVEVPFVQAR